MSDPLSGAATGLAVQGARLAIARAMNALRGSDAERLLALVAETLNDTGLEASGIEPFIADRDVVDAISAYLASGVLDEARVVAALSSALGELHPDDDANRLIARILSALKSRAWEAPNSDRAALVLEVRRLHAEAAARKLGRPISFEWVPPMATAAAEELSASHPQEAALISEALVDAPSVGFEAAQLIRVQPAWLEALSAAGWVFLGHLAAIFGQWEAAEQAYVVAADMPGADIAANLARASEMARASGSSDRALRHLNRAAEVEPTHPEVVVGQARELLDPTDRLSRLATVTPTNDVQIALVAASRALAHLALGDIAAAREEYQEALSARPTSALVREVGPLIPIIAATAGTGLTSSDYQSLRQSANAFLALRDELLSLGRPSEAVRMHARALEALTLSGEHTRATELLREARGLVVDADSASRAHLARMAVVLEQQDLAREFAANVDGGSVEARLALSVAELMSGTEEARERALADLMALMDEGSPTALQAAFALLAVASERRDVSWLDAAAALVQAEDPSSERLLFARRLLLEERREDAERILLGQDSPDALELLAAIAADRADWERARGLAEAAFERDPSPSRRLLVLESALRLGDLPRHAAELVALTIDESIPSSIRARAYAIGVEAAWNRGDYAEALAMARGWLDVDGSSVTASWLIFRTLVFLGRHAEAVATYDKLALKPPNAESAEFAAAAFNHSLRGDEATARIAALLDVFGGTERLDALFIHSALRTADDELPVGLQDRVRATIQEFPNRYPESRMIRAVRAPETPDEVEEFFRRNFADRAEVLRDTHDSVVRGDAPTAVLATQAGRELTTLWARLEALPLDHGSIADEELAAADAAVGQGAVWDSTALMVVAGYVPDEVSQQVARALPASVIPQTILFDVDQAAAESPSDVREEQLEAAWDPVENRPQVTRLDAAAVSAIRGRIERTLALAGAFRRVPDVDPTRPTTFDTYASGEQPLAFRTWPATFAVAAATGLPIFSDDRFVRAEARAAGMHAFGTRALTSVLAKRGMIDANTARAVDAELVRRREAFDGSHSGQHGGVISIASESVALLEVSDPWRRLISSTYATEDAAMEALDSRFILELSASSTQPEADRVRMLDAMVAAVDFARRPHLLSKVLTSDPLLAERYRAYPGVALTAEALFRVAHLARLRLTADEFLRFGEQLTTILAAVSKVSELDLSDVPATSHPLDVVNVWAEDEPRPCLPVDEVFANAPERDGNYFKVPPGGS